MADPIAGMRSHLNGVSWPALPSGRGANLLSLLYQFDQTQWWTADRLIEHQLRQLQSLLRHAGETVPFYQGRFATLGFTPGGTLTPGDWRALPILTRGDIQSAGAAMASTRLPPEYAPTIETQTSGAVGQPVKVRATQLDVLLWEAMTLRDHLWHQRDFSGKLAVIRPMTGEAGAPPHGTDCGDWGVPASYLYATGPMALMSLNTDIATQAEWLKRKDPDYLLTFPNNLMALIKHFSARGERLRSLRAVRTVSEMVTPELRAACRESWNVPITDSYSSQELGYIALQCPQTGQYHVMSESVLVEILAADGRPCGPGETGRLVVTSLHNFAMPLIRYDLRDYAEAGAPCACGRGLPTIARILGRSRNMVTLPDGRQHWPLVGFMAYREIAPIRQFQLTQHTREDIEVRFVVDRPLTGDEEARLARVIQSALGHPFRLTFTYVAGEIPRSPGGKFEEFVSKLAT